MLKLLFLGALAVELKGQKLDTEDTKEVEVISVPGATCDKNDNLCTQELTKWSFKGCPFAGVIAGEPELCLQVNTLSPFKATLSPDVLIDF